MIFKHIYQKSFTLLFKTYFEENPKVECESWWHSEEDGLLLNHEDLTTDPSTPHNKPRVVLCTPNLSALEDRDRRIAAASCLPA